jgi:hypothetical protein
MHWIGMVLALLVAMVAASFVGYRAGEHRDPSKWAALLGVACFVAGSLVNGGSNQ